MQDNLNRTTDRRMMTGLFTDKDSAERGYRTLRERGYKDEDINLVMSDDTRKRYYKNDDSEIGNKALEGTGAGASIGGTVGAIAGAVAAIGTTVAIPGLGLLVAGPIAAGLAGAGAGGITGGLIGALVGSGIPEDRAKVYESGVKSGGIVMGVKPKDERDAERIKDEWVECHAKDVCY